MNITIYTNRHPSSYRRIRRHLANQFKGRGMTVVFRQCNQIIGGISVDEDLDEDDMNEIENIVRNG